MEKVFKIFPPETIPQASVNNFRFQNQISDYYFAKCISASGNECKMIVVYDFKNEKWRSPNAGLKEVIEYYIELN